jgi:hypothetical protein
MQLVQLSHHQQVSVRDRTRLVVRRAATDPQHLGLLLNRELVRTADHLLALRSPAFVSAPSCSEPSTDLRMFFQVKAMRFNEHA